MSPIGILVILLLSFSQSNFASTKKLPSEDKDSKIPQPAERIRNEPESVWVEFIQLALDHKPLNLGQGFPDFAAPQYLVESLHNATRQIDGDENYQKNVLTHQYTRSFGHPRLVKALRKYYHQFRGFDQLNNEKEQILVTVGAYEALFCSIMAFVKPGDRVILIDPAFDAYAPMVKMAGGESVYVPLVQQDKTGGDNITTESLRLNMKDLENKLSDGRTSVLVLNTPNNPLGKVFSRSELEEIAKLCVKFNILVISDEVYEQFYYDSSQHMSIATLPKMWDRTITIGSAGKTFSVTGWKIGWAMGPKHLLRYLQLVHQTAVYTVATPLQEAVARSFEHEMNNLAKGNESGNLYWKELRRDLLRKRDKMAEVLLRAKLEPILPEGGYFMVANFSPLAKIFPEYNSEGMSNKTGAINSNDYKFARWLSRVKHLQGIPGSAFYSEENKNLAENLIRFCFIKSDETLSRFEILVNNLISDTKPNIND